MRNGLMNLRPNNTPALLIGAKLRVLFAMQSGQSRFSTRRIRRRRRLRLKNWRGLQTRLLRSRLEAGQVDSAEKTLTRAEELFAGYPYTLENLARVRMAENARRMRRNYGPAVAADRDPHVLYLLAAAQRAAGQADAAAATLVEF